ncbi:hypothetical protein [Streptomyces indicus]|uniref:Uncharacterized protein n=1 Tax=Streptomyces indicus TaxID=417292 RepID=A0A1G9EE92_9ACTN|nr:hypothetical protein [Streptomyces indicus]SDK74462.1 hypothetical protein SAMN05421806_111113 [Streptomyces indicus]
MAEDQLDGQAWSEALKLYEWISTFVGVAPRAHEEWWLDVGAIMRLETRDPRGWESIDPFEGEEERLDDPLYPWLATPAAAEDAEHYQARVKELPRSSVRSLLVLLGVGRSLTDLSRLPGWEQRRPAEERRAGVILSRFPEGTRFYTNLGWTGDQPDFYQQPTRAHNSFSQCDWDPGLIAVNDDEVAVIWTLMNE